MASPTTAGEIRGQAPNSRGRVPNAFRVRCLTPISGFTYIGLLIALAVTGAAVVAVGEIASTAAQRDRENELLFVGSEIRRAIGSYYERSPGGAKRYPQSLE